MNEMTCGGCGGPLDDPPPRCPKCQPDERDTLAERVRVLEEERAAMSQHFRRLMDQSAADAGKIGDLICERDAATARAEAAEQRAKREHDEAECYQALYSRGVELLLTRELREMRRLRAAEARAEALRVAIEQAPHATGCLARIGMDCDCWKARALAAGKTTTTEDKTHG